MVELHPDKLSFGTVFKYQDPFQYRIIREWGRDHDFEMQDQPSGEISFGPGAVEVENPTEAGGRDGFRIIFNPQGTLDGLGQVSFVTIQDSEGARFDELYSLVESLWSMLSDEGYEQDIELVEFILETRIRTGSEYDFANYVNKSHLDTFAAFGDQHSDVGALRLQGDGNKEVGWYQVGINKFGHPNPEMWTARVLKRHETYKEADWNALKQQINDLLEIAKN